MTRVTLNPPRCYIRGHRVHHGLVGLIIGVALVVEDRRDWRRWIPDLLGRSTPV